MVAAASAFGWEPARTVSPEWRKVPFVGAERPGITQLIDRTMSTPVTPKFGAQQYRAASAIAHSSPYAHGLTFNSTSDEAGRDAAQRLLPMVGAFHIAAGTLCHRMGWDVEPLERVAGITLRFWLEVAEPGSSRGLVPYAQ